ncbi:MAG: hypothetical protein PWQ93_653 [Clostridiales bacterium]|jgi:hypothetical protein|nr:hypothetical protein [Clostridiales bacterium]
MIIQKDPSRPNNILSINDLAPNELIVADFDCDGLHVSGKIYDLTPFQGGPFRLYVDEDGMLSTDIYRDHYWLIAEAIIPDKQYESVPTGQTDENGQPKTEIVERLLDLNGTDITVFPLPEEEAI